MYTCKLILAHELCSASSDQIEKNKEIIFSLPHTHAYQEIQNLQTIPKPLEIISDRYQNEIIFLPILPQPIITFSYAPKKISYTNIQNPTLSVIRSCYDETLNTLQYGNPIDGLYSAEQALKTKVTDCGGFSTVLAEFLAQKNIQSRLVSGFLLIKPSLFKHYLPLSFSSFSMHAWLEAQLPDNTWFPLDPAIEWRRNHNLTTRGGGFGTIPADRLVVSFGSFHVLKRKNIDLHIDILQKPITI